MHWVRFRPKATGSFSKALKVAALVLALAGINAAQAGLFDDEEARKQILQLRSQIAETQRTDRKSVV